MEKIETMEEFYKEYKFRNRVIENSLKGREMNKHFLAFRLCDTFFILNFQLKNNFYESSIHIDKIPFIKSFIFDILGFEYSAVEFKKEESLDYEKALIYEPLECDAEVIE